MKNLYLLLDISWGGDFLQVYTIEELVENLCINSINELVEKKIVREDIEIKLLLDMYEEIIAIGVEAIFNYFHNYSIGFEKAKDFIKSLDK